MFYGINSSEDQAIFDDCLGRLARIFVPLYASDDLITMRRNASFLEDEKLITAVEKALPFIKSAALREQARSKLWRLHTLTWSAASVLNIPGDYVECGAFDGFSAAVVAAYVDLQRTSKSYYIYDTFSGLSDKYATAEELKKNRFFEQHLEVYEVCKTRFKDFENVRIVKGVLPDILEESAPAKVSLLHIDLNCAQAELGTLEFFFDRVSTGGFILLDDYGKLVFRAQKDVADTFMRDRNHSVLELPTGQGLVLKR